MGRKKCSVCGRIFDAEEGDDEYCSEVCRKTGCFLNGGGDTSKPNVQEVKTVQKRAHIHPVKVDSSKYPRVQAMFEKPIHERWEHARNFTEEEQKIARKMAMKELREDMIIIRMSNIDEEEAEEYEGEAEDPTLIGESDDGSI